MRAWITAVALAVTACGGGQGVGYGYGDGESEIDRHVVDIQRARSANADYIVVIRNDDELGYDINDTETRHNTAIRAVRRNCPGARIVDERSRNSGRVTRDNLPISTYEVVVRCAG